MNALSFLVVVAADISGVYLSGCACPCEQDFALTEAKEGQGEEVEGTSGSQG